MRRKESRQEAKPAHIRLREHPVVRELIREYDNFLGDELKEDKLSAYFLFSRTVRNVASLHNIVSEPEFKRGKEIKPRWYHSFPPNFS